MSLVTSILVSCLSINLVRSKVGVIQNSAGTSLKASKAVQSRSDRLDAMRLPPSRSTRRRAFQRVTRGARHGPVSGYQRLSTSAHLSCGTFRVRQLRKASRPPRLFPNFPLHPPSRYRIDVRRTHAVPSIGRLHPSPHEFMDDAEGGEKNEKESPLLQIDPKWYVRHPSSFAWLAADRAAA